MHLLHTTSLYTSLSLLLLEPLPGSKAFKIILMYAPCDSYLTNLLHLVHRAAREHYNFHEETQMTKKPRHLIHHARHDLSNACMWVIQRTVAVIAVSNTTKTWKGIDATAHQYSLPHMVTPQFCNCSRNFMKSRRYSRLLDFAVYEYLKHTYLHDVIMLHEEDNEDGTVLTSLLSSQSIRVSHLGVQSGPGFLKTVERYFEKWNMVDLSDEGRLLISLAGGQHVDRLLRRLVQTSMHNKRTKLLVVDDPEKWQERLLSVKAYEVDLVIVGSEPLNITDCPTAIELLPSGSHSHKTEGKCKKLSSSDRNLGDSIIADIRKNLTSCCSQVTENDYTFWKSSLSENGTQRLKAVAVWSADLGILRMETIDVEMITLRIAIMEYLPYVIFNVTNGEVILQKCVFKEMILFLSKRLHFRYKLVTPPDEEWGSFVDGKWIGAIGMVIRGEADIIPYLTLTPNRQTVMDYSKPLAAVKYGILVAFPSEPPRAFIFLRPYRKEVWGLYVIVAVLMSYMLYLMHKWSCKICKVDKKQTKELSSYSRCFWLIYGATLQQGGTHLPVTNSARLVLSSWWIGVMVIMATYSANLIAFLAFPETKWNVKSLGDLARHKTIQLAIMGGCPVLEDFQESNIKVFEQIRKIYLKNPLRFRVIKRRNSKILEDVAAGKTVFIDDMNYLAKMVETDYQNHNRCRITIAPSTFSRKDFSLGLRRGSSLMPAINMEIQQMKESGVLRHWKDNHSPQRDECYDITTILQNHSVKVTLEDLQGPFYLLVLGLLIGMISLTSEFLWTKIKITYKRYMKRKFFIRNFHST